jgi:hypothetical protein
MTRTWFAALLCVLTAGGVSTTQGQESGASIKLEIKNQPLLSVLESLSREHGLNYVVSEAACRAAGAIHCRLEDVPLERAVQMLCAACNLEAEIQGRFVVIRVARGERPRLAFPSGAPSRAGEKKARSTAKAPGRAPAVSDGRSAPTTKKPSVSQSPGRAERARAKAPVDSPAPGKAELTTGTVIGKVLSAGADFLEVRADKGGSVRFELPEPETISPTFYVQLQAALARLQTGDRVVLTYRKSGDKRLINAIIGGRDPRDRSTIELPDRG